MRTRTLVLGIGFLCCLSLRNVSHADTVFVPDDFARITDALAALDQGDSLVVRAGIYSPSANNETLPLIIPEGVSIIGVDRDLCIIDGDNSDFVMECSGHSGPIFIRDLTIRGGANDLRGGGIFINNSTAVSLRNLRVTGNQSSQSGGGVAIISSDEVSIDDCIIDSNATNMWGGGVYCYRSSPALSNTLIANNNANRGGGIACFVNSSPVVDNCTIEYNEASTLGGGIDSYDGSSPQLYACTLRYNSAFKGGGFHLMDGSEARVEDSQFVQNSARYGGGVFSVNTGATVFKRNLFDGNHAGRDEDSSGCGGAIYLYSYSEASIDSNVIVNNAAGDDQGSQGYGGGMMLAEGPSPVITHNIIQYNTASEEGGGIWLNIGCSATIEYNDIQFNEAGYPAPEAYGVGGGVFINNGYALVRYNTISNNFAQKQAGGVFIQSEYPCNHPGKVFPHITENTISYNTSFLDGGGIATSECDSSSITRNLISHNVAQHGGGAIQVVLHSRTYIAENIIEENQSQEAGGGGIFVCVGSRPTIHKNVIRNNSAEGQPGGGIAFLERTVSSVTENLFSNNSAQIGGAMHVRDSLYVSLERNTFIQNSSTAAGDAIGTYGSWNLLDIVNNIFVEDEIAERRTIVLGAETFGRVENNIIINEHAEYPLEIQNPSGVLVQYNCFWNEEGDTVSQIGWDSYNFFADPRFVEPFALDFHLRSESPCIDAGNPESPLDPDGTIRDVGRFYYEQGTGVDDLNKELAGQMPGIALSQNFPNPFNPSTTIVVTLDSDSSSAVDVTIYDLRGRIVRQLFSGIVTEGTYRYLWDGRSTDGSSVGSGVYLCRARTNDSESIIKMILRK
jgi:hypothetical protein